MLVTDENTTSQDETSILHPSSRLLFRFWETMRAERPAPRRGELDLSQIPSLIPHLFIAQWTESCRTFRWRLAGTGICELFRRELTGSNMLADWDSFETDTISRLLSGTIANRQPCILRLRLQTDRAQMIGAELAGFPLLAADGETIHVFGGVFPFRDTRTLGYTALTGFELSAARSIWTENLPLQPAWQAGAAPERRSFHVIMGGRSQR